MTDIPAAAAHAYDGEIADYERIIHRNEALEIEARERRSYLLDRRDMLLWMLAIPLIATFLFACVWAIASN